MIHVQIASQLTADGVDGIRWVLVEPVDGTGSPAPTPAVVLATAADRVALAQGQADAALRGSLRLNLLKGLVILLGLGAALGMARMQFGAPPVRWWAPAPQGQPAPQPTSTQPAQPAPAPAQPGSAGSLVVRATIS